MRIIYITLKSFIFLAALILFSCTDFLKEKPDNRTLIKSLDEMEKALVGITPKADFLFTEIMSDNYSFKSIAGHVVTLVRDKLKPFFIFQITEKSFPRTAFIEYGFNPYEAWRNYFYRVENALLIIKQAEAYRPSKENQENERIQKNSIIGRAKAIYAYCNFMLVNMFAKQYDPVTAANDTGIPYAYEYSPAPIKPYKKETIGKIYDNIEKTLLEIIPLLNDKGVPNTKFHFTTTSVYALLCRLYLNKKDWDNCIKYADLVIDNNPIVLPISELWSTYSGKFIDFSKKYFEPKQDSYLLMSDRTYQLLSYFWSGYYPYPYAQFGRDKWGQTDMFIQTSPLFTDIIPIKYSFFYYRSNRRMPFPLLTVDEVYLNRAEALIEKGDATSIAAAKKDMRKIIENDARQTNAALIGLEAISTKVQARGYVLDVRRARFFGEGMRWFDLKRHQIPIIHKYESMDYKISGEPQEYVIQYPLEELDFTE